MKKVYYENNDTGNFEGSREILHNPSYNDFKEMNGNFLNLSIKKILYINT